ncbi:MAG: CDP-glycerol glycerophosphotransferase family protein [Acidobacteriota bacterium]|nr:MAG: CDP-glycerol glycerophosphotransferase family protein [Acidobacteriota bacterium]
MVETGQAGITADRDRPRILLLSSVLLMDRVFRYTSCLESLSAHGFDVTLMTTAGANGMPGGSAEVIPFPAVQPYRMFPYNYLRRYNDFLWDAQNPSPSRESAGRLIRDKGLTSRLRVIKRAAELTSHVVASDLTERGLEKLLLRRSRSPEGAGWLRRKRPRLVIATGPHRFNDEAIVAEALRLGLPVAAFITSWDNLSTKNRLVFTYDGFIVWSEQMKNELHQFYPYSRNRPVFVVGAPQFDLFFQERFKLSREEFCRRSGLDPGRPIIVYGLGSPNLSPGEWYAVEHLAKAIEDGKLGDAQLIVRPHPLFDNGSLQEKLKPYHPRVIVQRTADGNLAVTERFQDADQITDWVNTFRHADVVVNFSSTITVDAAIFDRPVVNLDFDPAPGSPRQQLYHEVNHVWTHFKPLAESGGIRLVSSLDEMIDAVRTYLAHPELHREQRRWIADYVCGRLDGQSGERMAEAIVELAQINKSR